jgi:hypothetical protein
MAAVLAGLSFVLVHAVLGAVVDVFSYGFHR